mmetsp:Transcript_43438/g.68025  ORF Transcript_43438/g.68025 Transcript_43438/m.68025 type:complete len:260 (+) Transcript_43438:785-1564(+)|eukprot:CAMPEP_0184288458 /NCGR_PEP_ID=MMETSP1049-20130417/983_1 /TAXON_ID=77928 /ORGANISM="Proteomonas sulcata, Strain CCMP704" /LENGTH=259 /DNA_ID=CAMNT_0026594863 /DNA_START=291 /DNA_END=1073 /DNA_ORIENTATION=-
MQGDQDPQVPPPPPAPPPPLPPTRASGKMVPHDTTNTASYTIEEDLVFAFKNELSSAQASSKSNLLLFDWLDCLGDQELDSICTLLNSQWARSRSARLQSLERKVVADGRALQLPRSLALRIRCRRNNHGVGESPSEIRVAGHARLLPCASTSDIVIESVIVAQHLRGLGLGKLLMHEVERRAGGAGVSRIWLSTSDKEEFYRGIGYSNTTQLPEQVSCVGAAAEQQAKLMAAFVRQRENTSSQAQWMTKLVTSSQPND